MTTNANRGVLARLLAGVALTLCTTTAFAAWNFKSGATWSGSGVGNQAVQTDVIDGKSVTVTARAFYGANNTTYVKGTDTVAGTAFAKAQLGNNPGSGLGVSSGGESGSPQHAVDNSSRTDMVLFQFSSAVVLESIMLGWVYGDADFSVLRYDGGTTGPSFDASGSLIYAGWTVVQNVSTSTAQGAKPIDAGDTASSWWLISAYNTNFGGGADSKPYDYFKIASLSGSLGQPPTTPPGQVPEPASLSLIGLALLGVLAGRRVRMRKR